MIYDLFLFLYLLGLIPGMFLGRLKGKRHPAFFQRLGFSLPKIKPQGIWIHAVSMGEVKAAVPFFQGLKKKYPDKSITITTTTATGFEQAKRSFRNATILFSPIDFSFVARKFVKHIDPSMFILVEGDFWPNLLKTLKCKTFLVSGKISAKSAARYMKFPKFAKKLFSNFDLLLVQSEQVKQRFLPFGGKRVKVTGNLKLDQELEKTQKLEGTYLTLSSTHPKEEDLLLDHLLGPWTLLLAPRHPERFDEVERVLKRKGISYSRYSNVGWKTRSQVLLIDCMGKLPTAYANSFAAIVGGSFVPGIGGHNVLEPCLYGCASLFGPHVDSQRELVEKVLAIGGGKETTLETILHDVEEIRGYFFSVPSMKQVTEKTMNEISLLINSEGR